MRATRPPRRVAPLIAAMQRTTLGRTGGPVARMAAGPYRPRRTAPRSGRRRIVTRRRQRRTASSEVSDMSASPAFHREARDLAVLRSGLVAAARRGRGRAAHRAAARLLHRRDDPEPRHAWKAAVSHRVAARLGHPSLPAELVAHAFHEAIAADPGHRTGVPRRYRRGDRPRSRDPQGPRTRPVLQGLPCAPGLPPGPPRLAPRPARPRPLPPEPRLGGVPVRHPSGGADRAGRVPRPRHRPRGRLDRDHRG